MKCREGERASAKVWGRRRGGNSSWRVPPTARQPESSEPGVKEGREWDIAAKILDSAVSEPGRHWGILRNDVICFKF